MSQLEHIEAIEKRLWNAADTLRANSNYASNEYFLPVMGLIFLRHAYSRFLAVREGLEAALPTRGGKTRPLSKEDFSGKSAIYLKPEAQFDYLASLKEGESRAQAIIAAMNSIEADYTNLRGVLPKSEYFEIENDVLGQLLRSLNWDELKTVSGDVFGRIYEYFLTRFAAQNAHDGGEFFTPISLVSLIAHVLEPDRGIVLDPASGSGGMFVQSARVVEHRHENPAEKLTFYGLEKNAITIRLAKMNLAVHGLEGNIKKAITYYEDPHELLGKADYVMANPPFNVDEIDAAQIVNDPRLPFGLPGVNKKEKVSNGNYVWISYFYSYLNERGRAGFVMSSQASSAGRDEAKVRRKLIETGDVEMMLAIRSNFFYTRTVPCELWFLNRARQPDHRQKVLMIDARTIYRKVTRKIFDFSPEQEQNIHAIVWLYRGEQQRYLNLVADYCRRMVADGAACITNGENVGPLSGFLAALHFLNEALHPFLDTLNTDGAHSELRQELEEATTAFKVDAESFSTTVAGEQTVWSEESYSNLALRDAVRRLAPLAESSRDLVRQSDLCYKLALRLIEQCETGSEAKNSDLWQNRDVTRARKAADEMRAQAVEQLKLVRYFWKQAHWLTERFPDGTLCDVEGLVKLVDIKEIEANDWSLTPGRYVGVTPEEEDEEFDFEESLREIHIEIDDLNSEAVTLAAAIKKNFEELGI